MLPWGDTCIIKNMNLLKTSSCWKDTRSVMAPSLDVMEWLAGPRSCNYFSIGIEPTNVMKLFNIIIKLAHPVPHGSDFLVNKIIKDFSYRQWHPFSSPQGVKNTKLYESCVTFVCWIAFQSKNISSTGPQVGRKGLALNDSQKTVLFDSAKWNRVIMRYYVEMIYLWSRKTKRILSQVSKKSFQI